MLIASCMESDADRRTLRLLNEHWKAAVDESVTRCLHQPYYTSRFTRRMQRAPPNCYCL